MSNDVFQKLQLKLKLLDVRCVNLDQIKLYKIIINYKYQHYFFFTIHNNIIIKSIYTVYQLNT